MLKNKDNLDSKEMSRRGFIRNSSIGVVGGVTTAYLPHTAEARPVIPQEGDGQVSPPQSADNENPVPAPASAKETWNEPWVWRPSDWPGQQLHLNVVENENPGATVGFGNPGQILFNYGGSTPGPTIRMRGDETLRVKLRNLLGEDLGQSPIGPSPDVALGALPDKLKKAVKAKTDAGLSPYSSPNPAVPAELKDDWCLGEHTNGLHSAHVTNLHTHGLHVRPGQNPDGTHSDNVILRVLSKADGRRREFSEDPECRFLRDDEQAGEANYEFRIGDVQHRQFENQPHPPGTHWYHPHSHGATHNQVSSGMAGFLLVEGDVDDNINACMYGVEEAAYDPKDYDPETPTGDYNYRERLMFMQRVNPGNISKDPDSKKTRPATVAAVNGGLDPTIIVMAPGAVERWRVLNGSVDGRGYKRFMVVEGVYDWAIGESGGQVVKYLDGGETATPVSRATISADKRDLYQLSFDGVTLVSAASGGPIYQIKDLSRQNDKTSNPLDISVPDSKDAASARLVHDALNSVFENGENIKNCFVRPNEVYLGPANRTDVIFKCPPSAAADTVYTVMAQAVIVHADTPQLGLQTAVAKGSTWYGPETIILAHIVVRGDQIAGGDFDVMSLNKVMPDVPPYLLPIEKKELLVTSDEVGEHVIRKPDGTVHERIDVKAGDYRTRIITYSGIGAAGFPAILVPQAFVDANPELENLIYAEQGTNEDGSTAYVLLSPNTRTMAVNGLKFDPGNPLEPTIFSDGAEEWAIYNSSITLWAQSDSASPDWQYGNHKIAYPITRKVGQKEFEKDHNFKIQTRPVDHPFHQHTNPFWVSRHEIPDIEGNLHNILDEPRWQDVVWVPRNTGRVLFRSRFPDYIGLLVNHCHILLHEDNGMMTGVRITQFAKETNYTPNTEVVESGQSAEDVSKLYPRPSLDEAYVQSLSFDDPNVIAPGGFSTGQVFPPDGIPIDPPRFTPSK